MVTMPLWASGSPVQIGDIVVGVRELTSTGVKLAILASTGIYGFPELRIGESLTLCQRDPNLSVELSIDRIDGHHCYVSLTGYWRNVPLPEAARRFKVSYNRIIV